jgi:hypothetical protein
MFDEWFFLSIALAIAIWIVAGFFERREHRRKIESVRARLRRIEMRKSDPADP